MRVMAFERDDIDARLPEPGERLLVLTPLRPQGLLPVRIGLDAVAVADMNSRFAFQAFSGSLQRRNAPALDVVEEDVEGRLVELDDVDAGGRELLGLLIEDRREFPGEISAAAVVRVVEGVDHGHGPGQGRSEEHTSELQSRG